MGNVELSVPRSSIRIFGYFFDTVDRTAHVIWLLSLGLNERYDYWLVRHMLSGVGWLGGLTEVISSHVFLRCHCDSLVEF